MDKWLSEFDAAMVKLYAISSEDAGMDDELINRYRDLGPGEAALMYGDDYDLDRVDGWWR